MAQSTNNTGPVTSPKKPQGCFTVFVLLGWVLFGNFALIMIGLKIADSGTFSYRDALYWAITGAMVILRYVDIAYLNGKTTNGEPATMQHWRRYSLSLVVIAGAAWGLIHSPLGGFLAMK